MQINKLDVLIQQLTPVTGNHPEASFIIRFIDRERKKQTCFTEGDVILSDSDVYDHCIDYIIQCGIMRQSEEVRRLNRQVSEGITSLTVLENWPNLSSIAKHANEKSVEILKAKAANGSRMSEELLSGEIFRGSILNAGNAEFQKVVTNYFNEIDVDLTFNKRQG